METSQQSASRPLLLAFLLSGYAALTWEMSWLRQLVSLFGVTWFALTTILTVFMAGIALGSVVAGRLVDRGHLPPLLAFAALELFLACYGLSFRWILDGMEVVYLGIARGSDLSFSAHAALRFLFGALILLPPTLASGATLPVAAKAFVRGDDRIGRDLALLYGANVVGAALGCLATTFFTIGLLGYPGTTWVGAGANVLAAAAAAFAGWRVGALPVPTATGSARSTAWRPGAMVVGGAYFVVGFGSLSSEVLWSRAFSQFGFNPTTYVFGLILVTFLLGHAAGSGLLFPLLVRRFRPERLFGGLQVAIGVFTVASVLALVPRPGSMTPVAWLRAVGLVLPPERAWLLVPAIAVPAMLSGAMFPLASRLSITGVRGLGTGVGGLAALSTVGGIAGSFLTGFWLMPTLGAVHCLVLLAGLQVLAGLWSGISLSGVAVRRVRVLGGLVTAAVLGLTAALAWGLPPSIHLILFPGEQVVAFGEGRNSSTAVVDHPTWGRFLMVHGERLKGGGTNIALADALAPEARQVAVIGLGTGSVTAEALKQQRHDRVTAIDIDGDLPRFIPLLYRNTLDRNTAGVFEPPRFRFVENDGRHFLLTTDEKFDIIVNDAAIYAWYLELSTREFDALARSRLEPEGIYAGRLHTWRITEEAFRREIATFIDVFPNAALWGLSPDIAMLVGRNGDRPVDRPADRPGDTAIRAPAVLWYDAADMARIAAGYDVITDAHPLHVPRTFLTEDQYPIIEYTAPEAIPGEMNHALESGAPAPVAGEAASRGSGRRRTPPLPTRSTEVREEGPPAVPAW